MSSATNNQESEWLEAARSTLEVEAAAIASVAASINDDMARAVKIILNHSGKVVISGIGKSGHIGQKIAATLCSTGTPAVFLHAAEAAHGDLGVYTPGDPTILLSKSGSTGELVRLVPMLRQFESPLIAILGNLASPLARDADVVLDAHITREADPLGVVPTASSIVALALGDALTSALMSARRFSERDFVRVHPGGQLGKNLWLHVSDVMHRIGDVAWVQSDTSLREVVIQMTEQPLGAACVVDGGRKLLGLVTDGDLRRALQEHEDIRPLLAQDVMTSHPVYVHPNATLQQAAHLMEDRPSQISVLPVMESPDNPCLGLIRLHDIHLADLT